MFDHNSAKDSVMVTVSPLRLRRPVHYNLTIHMFGGDTIFVNGKHVEIPRTHSMSFKTIEEAENAKNAFEHEVSFWK